MELGSVGWEKVVCLGVCGGGFRRRFPWGWFVQEGFLGMNVRVAGDVDGSWE